MVLGIDVRPVAPEKAKERLVSVEGQEDTLRREVMPVHEG
jgi:hypothetical protein